MESYSSSVALYTSSSSSLEAASLGYSSAHVNSSTMGDGLTWRLMHHINEQCVFVVCTTVNVLLIWLLLTERNREIRVYSSVLFINSIIDITFTFIIWATELGEFVNGQMFIFINGPLKDASLEMMYLQIFLWLSACCSVLLTPPLIFYYRYVLIVRGYSQTTMQMLMLTIIPLLCALHQSAAITIAAILSDSEREYKCSVLLNQPNWHDLHGAACAVAEPFNGLLIYLMVMAFIMETSAYALMCYCTVTVVRHLRAVKHRMSTRTIKLNNQMNLLLVTQMFLLLLFGLLPVNGMAAFVIFGMNMPGSATVMTICVSWLPVLNPLSTLFFVALFRRRVVTAFINIWLSCSSTIGGFIQRKILPIKFSVWRKGGVVNTVSATPLSDTL